MPTSHSERRRGLARSWGAALSWIVPSGYLLAQAHAGPGDSRVPELNRFDVGGGHVLRLLTVSGRQRGERLGTAMVPARLRTGGGPGVLVAAPSFDSRESEVGRLFWVSAMVPGGVVEEVPLEGLPVPGKLGMAMSSGGDFDGDGATEIVLGSPYASGLGYRAGAVTVLRWPDGVGGDRVRYLRSIVSRAHFGAALETVGDVNGDGFEDLVVGAPVMTGDWNEEGAAYLFLGGAGGLSTNSVWTAWGGGPGVRFGEEIRAAGDVNGDRFADVLVAAPRWGEELPGYGEVRLYLGCREGLRGEPAWVYRGPRRYGKAGRGLSGGVDLNGDGLSDVLVGLPGANVPGGTAGVGEVRFFLGTADGLASEPAGVWEGSTAGDGFGESLCVVGDMNGDGLAELAVGAPFTPIVGRHQGMLRVFPGQATGFSTAPLLEVAGVVPQGRYGLRLAALGDVDGDGLSDLGVGSPEFAALGSSEGRCDIVYGSRGLGVRPVRLEALRRPAFREVESGAAATTVLEVRRAPVRPSVGAGAGLGWRSVDGTLAAVAAAVIGVVYLAWRSARGKLESMRHRLHDFVGSELCRLDTQDPRVRRVTDELRAVVWAAKQENPTVIGLVDRLADWAFEYASERGLELRLDLPGPEVGVARVGSGVAELAQATVRVALANVVEHARASSALLRIGVTDGQLRVEVEDNGVGLPEDALEEIRIGTGRTGSQGLRGLRRRVEECVGCFRVENVVGSGTRVTVSLPIAGPDRLRWMAWPWWKRWRDSRRGRVGTRTEDHPTGGDGGLP